MMIFFTLFNRFQFKAMDSHPIYKFDKIKAYHWWPDETHAEREL